MQLLLEQQTSDLHDLSKMTNRRKLERRIMEAIKRDSISKDIPDNFVLVNNAGQSNGAGRGGQRVNDDSFNALCLRRGGNGDKIAPLTIANSGQKSLQENRNNWGNCPMFGFAEMYQHLLISENDIPSDAGKRQLVCVQTSKPATGIAELGRESHPFFHFKRSISRLKIILGEKQPFLVGVTLWTQGENDSGMSRQDYTSALIEQAEDFNETAHLCNQQDADHKLITWQVCSVSTSIALAQLDATAHPQIFLSGPSYQFDYDDEVHLNSIGSDMVGALYGLAWKRIYVDKVGWEPLKPISSSVYGNTIVLSFNKPHLQIDTDVVPKQPKFGFSAIANGVRVRIETITLINNNQIKIVLNEKVQQGTVIRYGATQAVGKAPYIGGAGNLRDTQGEKVKFRQTSLDNWCVLFEWEL
jgi:hypothetical protein